MISSFKMITIESGVDFDISGKVYIKEPDTESGKTIVIAAPSVYVPGIRAMISVYLNRGLSIYGVAAIADRTLKSMLPLPIPVKQSWIRRLFKYLKG